MIQFAEATPRSTPTPEDNERLGDQIAELAAHIHAATYRFLVLLREFDAREAWGWGFKSCAHWLSWRTGIAPGPAREKVRVARALGSLPLISAAMQRGELSYSKVRALTRVATADNETDLLEFAQHGTASHVERLVRAWRRVDRLEEAESEQLRHESRSLSLYPDTDGSWVLRGRLDPEVGAVLEKALESAREALYGRRASADTTPGQRRADALGLVAEQALAGGAAATERFQVVVHVDAETLEEGSETGQSVLAAGAGGAQRVPAETSRRIACDASTCEMTHDSDGRVLDVGRKRRTVPTPIRRALEHRDRHCRFPGCENRYCDAHHVTHWADGGATKLDNLMLLCRVHHRAVHEGGWRIEVGEMGAAGPLRFIRPNGRPMPDVPPPTSVEPAEALRRLRADNAAADGAVAGGAAADDVAAGDVAAGDAAAGGAATPPIGPWTPTPDWRGERLDLDWAIYVLRRGGDGRPSQE